MARPARRLIDVEPRGESAALEEEATRADAELAETLDSFVGVGGSDVTVYLYQIDKMGKYAHVKELMPPIDVPNLITELKDEYGPGDYMVVIKKAGKIATRKKLSIAAPRAQVFTDNRRGDDSKDMLMFMMKMSEDSKASQMQMMQMMMQSQMSMMAAIVPAMAGNKESMASTMTAMAGIMAVMKPEKPEGLGGMLDTIKAVKELMPDSGGGGGSDDLSPMGLVKAFAPMAAGLGQQMLESRQQRQQEQPAQAVEMREVAYPPGVTLTPPAIGAPIESREPNPITDDPVILALRDDVLYCFSKRKDPAFTADMLLDSLEQAEVPEDALFVFIAKLQGAGEQWPNWLAEQGLDVRADPAWANAVFAAMVEAYTGDNNGEDTDSAGEQGARQTLQIMARLSNKGSKSYPVRAKAVELCQGLQQKDYPGEARRCFEFCRDRIRYIRDIRSVELLHDADRILQIGAGDCDDKSILLSALLNSIGHRTRFIAVAFTPDNYSHVWAQVYCYGKWIDLEATEPVGFGERIPTRGVVATLYQEV